MALTDYTSFDDVRAALGVTSDELDDGTLSLKLYEFGLMQDLESVDLTLSTLYLDAKAAAAPTALQTRLVQSTGIYATYSVAFQLLPALPMFSFKEVTDGKAGDTRFALDPYKETSRRVEERFAAARVSLVKALSDLNADVSPVGIRSWLTVASPSRDPVTGT
jgi:hypothetical protein